VNYVALDNIVQGIPNVPQSMFVSDDVLDDVQAALAELPPEVRCVFRVIVTGDFAKA
jgi:hypothetical protein